MVERMGRGMCLRILSGWRVLVYMLLSPTLIILLVFLYRPAVETFTLSTQLTRLGAPKSVDVCFSNFTEVLIDDPFKLVNSRLDPVAHDELRGWLDRLAVHFHMTRTAQLCGVGACLGQTAGTAGHIGDATHRRPTILVNA